MTKEPPTSARGPLAGLRVLDLSRILAGPGATMFLGDMGAEVIKVEKPGTGDDTRGWGPPFLRDDNGNDTTESAYYLCANRNKRSVAIDIAAPEGQAIIRRLAAICDILVENHKVGGLAKYGLAYEDLKQVNPRLIYCSLTGFGQTGPDRHRAGYDFMIQAEGGIMSLTGPADGPPTKMAVAYADVLTGMTALGAILAALYHREKTGAGQHIDISLLDTQVASLWNIGQSYLLSGETPQRMGNTHAAIVPYEAFEASDGWLVLAVGNDRQFRDFCDVAGRRGLAEDPRFRTNADRVRHRAELGPVLSEAFRAKPVAFWLEALNARAIPCGPVNTLPQVFQSPQVQARGGVVNISHPATSAPVPMLANPIRFSETPVTYRHAPPMAGADTDDILSTLLNLDERERARLREAGVIASS